LQVYDWYTHAETLRRPTPRPPHCSDLGAIKLAAAHRRSDARRRGRAAVHQYLAAVERGWREMKGALPLRPACHHREERIRGHVQRCWSALLLIRVAEISTRPADLAHPAPPARPAVAGHPRHRLRQGRPALTPSHKSIPTALHLPWPPAWSPSQPPTPDPSPQISAAWNRPTQQPLSASAQPKGPFVPVCVLTRYGVSAKVRNPYRQCRTT
jgi:hypothetical protein